MTKEMHIPDLRTYAFHQKAAEILVADPERIKEVHQILENWLAKEGTQAEGWAQFWLEKMDGLSVQEIADLICLKDEKMDFYRKSSPFSCLLSEYDRLNILQRYKFDHG